MKRISKPFDSSLLHATCARCYEKFTGETVALERPGEPVCEACVNSAEIQVAYRVKAANVKAEPRQIRVEVTRSIFERTCSECSRKFKGSVNYIPVDSENTWLCWYCASKPGNTLLPRNTRVDTFDDLPSWLT